MDRRFLLLALFTIPFSAFAQKKEILDMQRDVAMLQDQVRTLKSAFDEKMGQVTLLLQQSVDAQKDVGKAVTVLETRLNDKLGEQAKNVGVPVVALGSKVDQMSTDFQSVSAGMNDLVSRMGKLEQKLVDLSNAVRTMQSAPPPPSPSAGLGTTAPAGSTGAPTVSAERLYEDAYRDKISGKSDLALKGFTDYLTYYQSTDKAPNAQFWLGTIYYENGDVENALKHFDGVVTGYGENFKIPDAMLMKGRTLARMDRRNAAIESFRSLSAKYPKSDAAPKACIELKDLGVNCATQTKKAKR